MVALRQNAMKKTVAYIMSRFPKISETFILYEILELEKLGLNIEIFPLIQHNESTMHPEAKDLVRRAHYCNLFSTATLSAQVYWLCKRPKAYLSSWWSALHGNIGSWKFFVRVLIIVPTAARFARQMVELNVKHVHAHWATHPALAGYVIHKLTRIPYSFTAHAHDLYVERPMLEEKIRKASFVVTISEYNRRLIRELFGIHAFRKTSVIHCGIDPGLFQVRSKRGVNNTYRIICVGRLVEMKGQTYLVEACKQLKDMDIDFHCVLVGDGENRHAIQAKISRLGLTDRITLMGSQPRHRVIELMKESDVVALPSVTTHDGNREGIPVSLMEALAMELPVIATSYSGIPELIEHKVTGLLIPERDVGALVDALKEYYYSRETGMNFAAAGRDRVICKFNLRKNTEALLGLLNKSWHITSDDRAPMNTFEEVSSGNET